ncbi:hypothetical protein PG994_002348 [Apiospora phragmitis]|uniref:Uncharacterized protein n=1 Tax=Apiospora phragmitis TaxID=2905665 RepID=A0ABR1WW36_9PEZI
MSMLSTSRVWSGLLGSWKLTGVGYVLMLSGCRYASVPEIVHDDDVPGVGEGNMAVVTGHVAAAGQRLGKEDGVRRFRLSNASPGGCPVFSALVQAVQDD